MDVSFIRVSPIHFTIDWIELDAQSGDFYFVCFMGLEWVFLGFYSVLLDFYQSCAILLGSTWSYWMSTYFTG